MESCNRSISHYRRKHAPLRRYLPAELNAHLLYKYFCEMYPDIKVTYKTYWMQVKSLNISFAKLGLEQCETCLIYDVHMDRSVENII